MINPLSYHPPTEQSMNIPSQCDTTTTSSIADQLLPFLATNPQLAMLATPSGNLIQSVANSQIGHFDSFSNSSMSLPGLSGGAAKFNPLFPNFSFSNPTTAHISLPFHHPMSLISNDENINVAKNSTDNASSMCVSGKNSKSYASKPDEMDMSDLYDLNSAGRMNDLNNASRIKSLSTSLESNLRSTSNTSTIQQKTDEDFCDFCQKHFCNKYYLRKHKADVHGIHTLPYSHNRRRESNRNTTQMNRNSIDRPMNLNCTTTFDFKKSILNLPNSRHSINDALHFNPTSHEDDNINPKLGPTIPSPFFPGIPGLLNKMEPMMAAQYYLLALASSYPNMRQEIESDSTNADVDDHLSKFSINNVLTPVNAGDVECEFCHKIFCNQYFLHIHKISHHTTEQSSEVNMSPNNDITEQVSSLNNSNEGWNFLKDRECPSAIKSLDAFKSSMVAAKLADRVTCDLCNKELCNKYFLRTHKIRVHGVAPDTNCAQNKRSSSMIGLSSNSIYAHRYDSSDSIDNFHSDFSNVPDPAMSREESNIMKPENFIEQNSSKTSVTGNEEKSDDDEKTGEKKEMLIKDESFMNRLMNVSNLSPNLEWYNEATSVILCPLCSETIGPRLFLPSHLIDRHGLNPMNPLFFLNILAAKPAKEEDEIREKVDAHVLSNQSILFKRNLNHQNKMPVLLPELEGESPKSESTSPTELSISPSSMQPLPLRMTVTHDQQMTSNLDNSTPPDSVSNGYPHTMNVQEFKESNHLVDSVECNHPKSMDENSIIDSTPRNIPIGQTQPDSPSSTQQHTMSSDLNIHTVDIFNFSKSFQEASILPVMKSVNTLSNPAWYNSPYVTSSGCLSSPNTPLPASTTTSSSQNAFAIGLPRKSPNQMRVLCEICNKWICNKYFLRTHKANKHGIADSTETGSIITKHRSTKVSYLPLNDNDLWTPPRGERLVNPQFTCGASITPRTSTSPLSLDKMDHKHFTETDRVQVSNAELFPLPLSFPPIPSAMYASMLPFMSPAFNGSTFAQPGLFPTFLPSELLDNPMKTARLSFGASMGDDDGVKDLSTTNCNPEQHHGADTLSKRQSTSPSSTTRNNKCPLNLCIKEYSIDRKRKFSDRTRILFKQPSSINQQLASRSVYRARRWHHQRLKRDELTDHKHMDTKSTGLKRRYSIEDSFSDRKTNPLEGVYSIEHLNNSLTCPLCPTYLRNTFLTLNMLLQHLALSHGCARNETANFVASNYTSLQAEEIIEAEKQKDYLDEPTSAQTTEFQSDSNATRMQMEQTET